jgi:hypothetical protein
MVALPVWVLALQELEQQQQQQQRQQQHTASMAVLVVLDLVCNTKQPPQQRQQQHWEGQLQAWWLRKAAAALQARGRAGKLQTVPPPATAAMLSSAAGLAVAWLVRVPCKLQLLTAAAVSLSEHTRWPPSSSSCHSNV